MNERMDDLRPRHYWPSTATCEKKLFVSVCLERQNRRSRRPLAVEDADGRRRSRRPSRQSGRDAKDTPRVS